jgi:hypothetical protein
VVGEDIHLRNIPHITEVPIIGPFIDISHQGQVRHHMRSHISVPSRAAHFASSGYIWDHLFRAWFMMNKAVNTEEETLLQEVPIFGVLFGHPKIDFNNGILYLAQALHPVEDSFAPGHVTRMEANPGCILEVHPWDADNMTAHYLPDGSYWEGHGAYDNPWGSRGEISRKWFWKGVYATTEILLSLFETMDQNQDVFVQVCGGVWNRHFNYVGK